MYENNLNFIVADYFWLLYMCAIAHTYDVDRILVGSFLHFYFNHMFGLGPTSHGNGKFYDQGYGMKLLDFSVWGLFYKTFVICN